MFAKNVQTDKEHTHQTMDTRNCWYTRYNNPRQTGDKAVKLHSQGKGAQVEIIGAGQKITQLETYKGRKWGSDMKRKSYFETKTGNDKRTRE